MIFLLCGGFSDLRTLLQKLDLITKTLLTSYCLKERLNLTGSLWKVMILILSPSANFCNKVLTSENKNQPNLSLVTKSMTYSSDIMCYEIDFFVAAKKFVAGIQFCRSATSFGSDKSFMKRPPGQSPHLEDIDPDDEWFYKKWLLKMYNYFVNSYDCLMIMILKINIENVAIDRASLSLWTFQEWIHFVTCYPFRPNN